MFRDRIRLKMKAGRGGNGKVAFGPYHRPLGGNGGNGGDIYVQGSESMYDFSALKTEFTYAAGDGEAGGSNNLTGRNGKDLIIKVPLKTLIYDLDDKLVASVDKPNVPQLLLKGGEGGLGNWYFRKGGIGAAEVSTLGKDGESLKASLVLELQSDIIFIGLPNAGKSSILNELSNADAKVAAYAFTTLSPQLGRMGDIVLMDLPGLIEKTSEGKGLGTSFVKHTKSSKLVAHFVSLESDDPVRDYRLMRDELKAIDAELAKKPEIIILTKTDVIPAADIESKKKLFKKFKRTVTSVSTFDFDALEELKKVLEDSVQKVK